MHHGIIGCSGIVYGETRVRSSASGVTGCSVYSRMSPTRAWMAIVPHIRQEDGKALGS